MIGIIGGNYLDIIVDDISFNDDNTAMVIGRVQGNKLSEKNIEFLENKACETFEKSDKNLHKFITNFLKFKVIDNE